MNERTKNLRMRKPEDGFSCLAAVLLSFSIAFAACNSPVDSQTDNADSPDLTAAPVKKPAPGAAQALSSGKKIAVKFEVQNGGWGLWSTDGIVSTEDDSYLVRNHEHAGAGDYTLTLKRVHAGDKYLNIRWRGSHWGDYYHLKAKLALPDDPAWTDGTRKYTIVIDFNLNIFSNKWDIKTKNLYDVRMWKFFNGEMPLLNKDWNDAFDRAEDDENPLVPESKKKPAGAD